jgi:hypothetical protein
MKYAHNKGMRNWSDSRYLAKLHTRYVIQPDGCWLWKGSTITDGYGQMCYRGKPERAHRLMYTLTYGPIPAALVVMHSCDVRHCVNPAHLSLGTQQANIRDAVDKGRPHRGTLMSRKTHCAAGHPYAETARWEKGRRDVLKRACKVCQRIAGRRKAGWPEAFLNLPPQKLGQRPSFGMQNEVAK